ncbi:uncharacterized protein BX664DRAFT_351059 [Halteromyces radiatus]|uniref:uncharacterized protein n=1 Tax=Halteromyces radiatus TaxID=101107 RepID=UPI00221EBC11|nr:uncharacterized protein BX664DRAFT_351059 [Halteromyces radiatus]KAI8086663.1 hypothetical protein BX664DRAFT_351059 [Halteromyces radiatus]
MDTLTLAHDPSYQNSGLYSQMLNGHHYFMLSFWSDEDHSVLIFVCLRAMDLVEDDQSLESFMNVVTEFCAQVVGGQNATRRKFSYSNCYDDIGFTGGTKHSMIIVYTKMVMQTFNDIAKIANHTTKPRSNAFYVGMALLSYPIEVSVSNKIVLPKVQVMIVILVMALVVILVVVHGYYRL